MYKMIVLCSMALSLLLFAPYGFADEEVNQGAATQMKVSGVVSKVQSGLVTVKTSWGSMTFSLPGSENLKVGEEVDMQVNNNNAVIDVHRKGEAAHSHRYVSGALAYTAADRREIKLWTPEGEKTFDVQAGRSKLASMEEGASVTIELNEAGKVIDIHRLVVEMSFNTQPKTKAGYRVKTHGTVEKIESGLVFLRGPFASYQLSVKTAPRGIAVGDEMDLWLDKENMVIDHHMKGHTQSHRLVSGKLVYVGRAKKQIKLWTPEGEKVFPLERLDVKARPIKEGSMITIELNEDGTVIDLWKAS
ncbi:MAG: hypothetical protein L0H94_07930 [Nitrospira sp.]|nr:hypothetical protein [Nitrospira sp.]